MRDSFIRTAQIVLACMIAITFAVVIGLLVAVDVLVITGWWVS